ncbi:MAG: phage integrase central domain-containing protein [Geodermatophilaceae bacterium]
MGRPPLPVGTFGKVLFVEQANGRVQARAMFRDHDGRARLVSKIGRSRAAAERALKAELAVRVAPGGSGALTAAMRVDSLADAWLAAANAWSTGTERTYASIVRAQVKPALGQLRVREVSPGVVSRALAGIAAGSGPSAAKSTRACLSGMFALAVRDGAIAANPVATRWPGSASQLARRERRLPRRRLS